MLSSSCWIYTEVTHSSDKLINFQRTTWPYFREDRTSHSHCWKTLKSTLTHISQDCVPYYGRRRVQRVIYAYLSCVFIYGQPPPPSPQPVPFYSYAHIHSTATLFRKATLGHWKKHSDSWKRQFLRRAPEFPAYFNGANQSRDFHVLENYTSRVCAEIG